MLKLIAPNGDVLFHLEGKGEQEESAEIFKFPEIASGYAASLLQEEQTYRATNPAWRTRPLTDAHAERLERLTRDQREMNAADLREAQRQVNLAQTIRLENLQREMDGVLGRMAEPRFVVPRRELNARVQFTGEQIAEAHGNPGAFARTAQADARDIAQQALYAENLRRIDEMRHTVEDLRVDSIDEEDEVNF
jgi:sulfite reductase beta subunit-like hemoprotein